MSGAFQQGQRVHFFLGRHLVNGFRGRQCLLDLRFLQGLQLEQHPRHIAFDGFLRQAQLTRGLRCKARSLAGGIQVKPVHMEDGGSVDFARYQQIDAQGLVRYVSGEASNTPVTVAEAHEDFMLMDDGFCVLCRLRDDRG